MTTFTIQDPYGVGFSRKKERTRNFLKQGCWSGTDDALHNTVTAIALQLFRKQQRSTASVRSQSKTVAKKYTLKRTTKNIRYMCSIYWLPRTVLSACNI